MKMLFCLLMVLVLLLSACGPLNPEPTEPPTEAAVLPTESTVPPTKPVELYLNPELEELRLNLPKMDGSTSLIPLEAGLRSALFAIPLEEAAGDVMHSSTWGSFWNLLDRQTDLIFSCPLSPEQYDYARERSMTLETVPIAKEGFVFVVNGENPVNSLTQQQIKDIYSGKITNWKEVGGLDEEIIPYQRNTDSGSQNYMQAFMGDTPLMDAPTEMRPHSMEGLMDVVAMQDDSRAALGYSVYAYAADMYGNGNEIKFIQVDGVAPSKKTFASGEYPLLGENFVVFDAAQPEDSYVRQFVDWCCSYEGQLAIARAGYVTVMDIGFDYEEMTLAKYQGTGTGPEAQGDSYFGYSLYAVVEDSWGSYEIPCLLVGPEEKATYASDGSLIFPDTTPTYRVKGLADQALQQEINDFISQQLYTWGWEGMRSVFEMVEKTKEGQAYGPYSVSRYFADIHTDYPLGVAVTCDNGYLSVAVSLGYSYNTLFGENRYLHTETATWDILSGRQLSVEELFCQGVDIADVLNPYLKQKSYEQSISESTVDYTTMQQDFAALPATGWHMTHDAIYFDQNNPYFPYGARFSLEELPAGIMTASLERDFSQALSSQDLICRKNLRLTPPAVEYKYITDDGDPNTAELSCAFLREDVYPAAKEINRRMWDYLATYYTMDAVRTNFSDVSGVHDIVYNWDWDVQCPGNRYAIFRGELPYVYLADTDSFIYYEYPCNMIFDLETGERLEFDDIMIPGWFNQPDTQQSDSLPRAYAPGDTVSFAYIGEDRINAFILMDGVQYYLSIPTTCLAF